MNSLYIASTEGSGGKTTLAVGLCLAFRSRGVDAGYFKPVGTRPRAGAGATTTPLFVADAPGACRSPRGHLPGRPRRRRAARRLEAAPRSTPWSRVARPSRAVAAGNDTLVCEGLGEIWQGRFLRTSGADVVTRLDLRTAAGRQVRRHAAARRHLLHHTTPSRKRLLGVMFNMVPDSRLERRRRPVHALPGRERHPLLRHPAVRRRSSSAVSVAEIAAELDGRFLVGEEYVGRPRRDLPDRRHEPRARPALLPAHVRTRS